MSNYRAYSLALPERQLSAVPPAMRAAVLHAACVVAALSLAQWVPLRWSLLEALFAVAGGVLLGLAPWWLAINAFFVPALDLAMHAALPPVAWLAAFVIMMLLYWGVAKTQVPLFMSSAAAARALAQLLATERCRSLLDLGCGDARLITRLLISQPDTSCSGIEYAPLPWLAGKLRLLLSGVSCPLWRGDFWGWSLAPYDCVYAYLSPVPMPALWAKARAEMRRGSLFVSNSFPVPDIKPDAVIKLNDGWGGCLYVYRM